MQLTAELKEMCHGEKYFLSYNWHRMLTRLPNSPAIQVNPEDMLTPF